MSDQSRAKQMLIPAAELGTSAILGNANSGVMTSNSFWLGSNQGGDKVWESYNAFALYLNLTARTTTTKLTTQFQCSFSDATVADSSAVWFVVPSLSISGGTGTLASLNVDTATISAASRHGPIILKDVQFAPRWRFVTTFTSGAVGDVLTAHIVKSINPA